MDNLVSNIKDAVEKKESESSAKKEEKFIELKRYDEVEAQVKKALESDNVENALLLNELTLARNMDKELSKGDQKQFNVIYVAFKGPNGVIKRAGVYNSLKIKDSEDAEDVLICEDFDNMDVLAVPRNSIFAAQLIK